MTDTELIAKQQKEIERLVKQVARLKKRLIEKKKYETETLIQQSATPQFRARIDAKDEEVLSS